MAMYGGNKTTSTTAAKLVTTRTAAAWVVIQNADPAIDVIIGGSDVSYASNNGIVVVAGDSFTFPYAGGANSYDLQDFYVASASGTPVVRYTFKKG